MISLLARATELEITDVRRLAGDSLEISVSLALPVEDPLFRVVSSSSILVPLSEWREVSVEGMEWVDANTYRMRVMASDSFKAFYRVIFIKEPSLPSHLILLSEVCSSNSTVLADDDGDFSDWIELYNPGSHSISLNGWMLSDDSSFQNPWVFPEISLDPGEYLLVFASGKDRHNAGSPLHTSFRINADGEPLILKDAQNAWVDAIRVGALASDTSLGRLGSHVDQWVIFESDGVSPLKPNAESGRSFIEAPGFSMKPGFYGDAVSLSIHTLSGGGIILYSLNGDDPWSNGFEFEGALNLEETTVVRSVAVNGSGERSEEVTGTFFVDDAPSLAVVSLAAPADNFDIHDGFLYGFGEHMFGRRGTVNANFPYSASNAWKDREIPISFELFEPDGNRGFQQRLGTKVFGGWGSRGYPQKSLAFFARSEYGKGKVRYPMFSDLEIDSFESFVLRNSGNDNQSTRQIPPRTEITAFGRSHSNGSYFVNGNYTLMRDAMLQRLAENLNVDRQGYRPVVVFLNGDYWGIYNLREKLNEHYVTSHHGVEPDEIDLIEGYGAANSGSSSTYNAMRNYMQSGSMASGDRYTHVTENYLDVSSFTDYHLAVIYFQNFDIGNIKQWRDRNNGLFRWMLYDQDYGFHLWKPDVYLPAMRRDYADYGNMFDFHTNTSGSGTGWPNASGRTMMLRQMLENEGFRHQFINRCADLLNTDFERRRVTAVIDQMAAVLRPEIPRHLARWSWSSLLERHHGSPFDEEDEPLSLEQWEGHIEGLKQYGRERPDTLRQDLMAHFGLISGTYELQVDIEPPEAGVIRVNTTSSSHFTEGRGIYFRDVAINCVAEPSEGYRFLHWNAEEETSAKLQLSNPFTDSIQLKAHFTPTSN